MGKNIDALLKKIICAALILSLTGCWNRRELDTLALVMGIGIDKSDKPGLVHLTAQIAKPGEIKAPKEGGGGGGNAYWNIRSSGETVFDAIRGFTHETSRKLFFPHSYIVILSQDEAKKGVQKYIDFFVRDPETRLSADILVSKGRADKILEAKSELEKIPSANISKLLEAQAATSETSVVKFRDFTTRMLSKTTAPIAPLIYMSGEGEKKTVSVSGTAVFKKDKLVGELDQIETRGLLWVINEIKSGIIVVDSPGGDSKVSLEIIRAKSKIIPEIEGDTIKIKVNIKEEGNLADQASAENLALPPKMELLQKEKASAIKGEVMAALKKARKLNADIFGFGEAIHQKYPEVWKSIEENWDDIFPDIAVEVDVETYLRLTGKISKPVAPE